MGSQYHEEEIHIVPTGNQALCGYVPVRLSAPDLDGATILSVSAPVRVGVCAVCKDMVLGAERRQAARLATAEQQRVAVEHPPHYTAGKVECIDAIEAAVTGMTGPEAFLVGQVLKYVWRFKRKNGVEDLEKAQWYLKRLTEHEKGAKK